MPELPEVECWGRRVAEKHAVGKVIEAVWCADDRIVFDGVAPRTVARRLRGRTILAARRVGKQLWLELDAPPHPLFHFGMSGRFHAYRDPADRPRFCKIELTLADGQRLAMPDARRFGRIKLREDPPNEPPIAGLGPDPLTDLPRLPAFRSLIAPRRGNVKGLLLNQRFLAGIGNWIADEVLYAARVSPHRAVGTLDASEVQAVHRAIRTVIRDAVKHNADYRRFPATMLFHRRWGRPDDALTHDGHEVQIDTVAGRSTAWVPAIQR